MNPIKKLHFLLLICSLAFVKEMTATHLMGGNMSYEYVRRNSNGNYEYIVTLRIYRFCEGKPEPAKLDSIIDIGAWEEDTLSQFRILSAQFTIPLTTTRFIVPPSSGSCTSAPNVCVQEGVYTQVIELPYSANGYHLMHERCCRNGNITNLNQPGAQGQTYYAFIPPSDIINSSPVFLEAPVPYFCAGETVSVLNTAIDQDLDGDSLVYTLVNPFRGNSDTSNAKPNPTNYFLYDFPIPTVNYATNYNQTQPFGTGGVATVDASTGLSIYKAPKVGYYVIAIEVKEYRNNQLIGIIRRDMQLIAIACDPNPLPILSPTTSTISYTINAGDTLCFTSTYTDRRDSIYLNISGDIFNAAITNPPATMPNAKGLFTVSSQFCWNTTCNQAGNYIFFTKATDNGCPIAITNTIYTIQVLPYAGPNVINGIFRVCANQTGTTYSVTSTAGSTYQWTVTGGTQTSGGNSNVITVTWGAAGSGSVCVTETNSRGCTSTPLCKTITINQPSVANAGRDTTICKGNSTTLNASGGVSYLWTTSAGLSSATIFNPVATPAITTNYIVTVTDANTCQSKDTVTITVNSLPTANAGNDAAICKGSNTTLNASGGVSYSWTPTIGLSSISIFNPIATPTTTTNYIVTVTDANTCQNKDTVTVTVNSLPIANAGRDTAICKGNSTTLNASGGTSYSWAPSAGLSFTTIFNPVATPTTTTNYTVTVTDANTCQSKDTVTVTVNSLPTANAGRDTTICKGDSTTLNASGGLSYSWTPSAGLSSTTIFNPVAKPTITTNYIITVTDANTCQSKDTVAITVNSLPTANAGNDAAICKGSNTTLNASGGGSYSWTPTTGLSSISIFNPVANPTLTTNYIVTVTDANTCQSKDTVTLTVNPLPTATAGTDISICIGGNATIGTTGQINSTYTWNPTTGLSSSTLANPIATPTTTTNYIVTVTDTTNTCQNTDAITITVNPLPTVNAGTDKTICKESSTTLNASGGISYSWTPSTGLSSSTTANPIATPSITTIYTVTATDVNGCNDKDIVTVTVSPLPIANAGNDVAICIGKSTTLNASGGGNYSWSPSLGLSASSIFNPIATPTVTTNYILTVTDANTCQDTDAVTISVNPLLIPDLGPDVWLCPGDDIILNAHNGVTYNWTPATGLNNTSIATPLAAPANTTTYTVSVTDANSCINADTITITVNAIVPTDAGADKTICWGDRVRIGGAPTGPTTENNTYSWFPATGLSSTTVANPIANPVITTTYTVTVVNDTCHGTDIVTIFVKPLPIANAGTDTAICTGSSTTLTASGGKTYSWTPASNLSSTTIFNPIANPTSTTNYTVMVTDSNSCKKNDTVTVKVNPLPIVNAGTDRAICIGNNTTIGGTPTGPNKSTYMWNPTTGLSSVTISNPIANPTSTINYTLTVTDTNICQNTDNVIVKVNSLPTVNAGTDRAICIEKSTVIGGTPTGPDKSTYSWTPVTGLGSISISNPIANPTITTNYIVTVIDSNTCQNTDTVVVKINPLPKANAGNDVAICSGSSTTLTASGGKTYSWTPETHLSSATIFNPVANPSTTTDYTVSVTDTNTCQNTDTVTIKVNSLPLAKTGNDTAICLRQNVLIGADNVSGNSYKWTSIPSGFTSINSKQTISPSFTTTYILTETIIATTCTKTDSITITVHPLPAAITGKNTNICLGNSVIIGSDSVIGNNYNWTSAFEFTSNNSQLTVVPFDTTTYTLTETIRNTGCTKTDSIRINVWELPLAGAGMDIAICYGDTATLNAGGIGKYNWSPSTGLSNDTIANPKAFPATTTSYILTVTNAYGCIDKDTVIVKRNSLPLVSAGTDKDICIGDSVMLNGSGGSTYLWKPSADLDNPNTSNPYTQPSATTTYTVIVTDINTCTNSASVTIRVNSIPIPGFSAIYTPSCDGMMGEFTNKGTGADTYLWNFGDGTTSEEENPVHLFPYSQSYTIKQIAINNAICRDTLTVSNPISSLNDNIAATYSNVFTPNSDGINDLFQLDVKGNFRDCSSLVIYNRWGVKVMDTNVFWWDGRTTTGKEAPDGIYFYVFKIKESFVVKGAVTLLR